MGDITHHCHPRFNYFGSINEKGMFRIIYAVSFFPLSFGFTAFFKQRRNS